MGVVGNITYADWLLDASIVKALRNRNTCGENAAIRNGEVPENSEQKPGKLRQNDLDAGWVKKSGETHYGCRNHADVDRKHKLVRRCHAADASVHDSQAVDHLLDTGNRSSEVRADSACRPEAIDERLRERGLKCRIHRKGRCGNPPGGRCRQGSRARSKARVRAGHVFGARANGMGGALARVIGMTRAKAKIGLRSLVCNMQRSCYLSRMTSFPSLA